MPQQVLFSQIKPLGETLDLKERHIMCSIGKLCYIFGGYLRIGEKYYGNMHVFDTGNLTVNFELLLCFWYCNVRANFSKINK
jgi:hypothetical protein